MEAEPTIKYSKPSFDGRLQYYEVLKEYFKGLAQTMVSADLNTWLRILDGLYSHVCPFLKVEDRQTIEESLERIDRQLSFIRQLGHTGEAEALGSTIDRQLRKLQRIIIISAKDLLLPTSTGEGDDFDEREFMRLTGR